MFALMRRSLNSKVRELTLNSPPPKTSNKQLEDYMKSSLKDDELGSTYDIDA
jgi:hypothetical protein